MWTVCKSFVMSSVTVGVQVYAECETTDLFAGVVWIQYSYMPGTFSYSSYNRYPARISLTGPLLVLTTLYCKERKRSLQSFPSIQLLSQTRTSVPITAGYESIFWFGEGVLYFCKPRHTDGCN